MIDATLKAVVFWQEAKGAFWRFMHSNTTSYEIVWTVLGMLSGTMLGYGLGSRFGG